MVVEELKKDIKENIDDYLREYRDKLPDYDPETEAEMKEVLQKRNYLTKNEVKKCIQWKMESQGGRAIKNKERLDKIDNEILELVTKAAFKLKNVKIQLKLLSSLPGIGNATATVLLTFNDPDSYAVGDRYMNALLLYNGEEKEVTPNNYSELLEELRKIRPESYSLRQVEKACYIKYREKR